MVTKAVSDQFGKGGIADQMIRFNGFPFLEHEDQAYNVPGTWEQSDRCFPWNFELMTRSWCSIRRDEEGNRLYSIDRDEIGRTWYVYLP